MIALVGPAGTASAQATGDHSEHEQGDHVVSPDGLLSMPADHLQVMIEETPPGGTLLVPEAIYVGTISIAEPVTLEGQGRPVIDGNFEGSVVTITAPDVTLRGLTLRRSATGPVDSPSGVLLERADRAVIDDVTIEQSYMGITVRLSEDVLIDGVSITGQGAIAGEEHVTDTDAGTAEHRQHASGDQAAQMRIEAQIRGDGIWLWNAPQATVRDTRIEYTRDGIYVSYGTGALLEGNEILHSRYAVHDMYTEDLTVRANLFEGNLSGLVLMYGGPPSSATRSSSPAAPRPGSACWSRTSEASGSSATSSPTTGSGCISTMGRTGGDPTLVRGNTIAMNHIGLLLMPAADTVVVGNGFVETRPRSRSVVTAGPRPSGVSTAWATTGATTGFDAGGDGTGDLAYIESGRMSDLLASEPLLLAPRLGAGVPVVDVGGEPMGVVRAPRARRDPRRATRPGAPGRPPGCGRASVAAGTRAHARVRLALDARAPATEGGDRPVSASFLEVSELTKAYRGGWGLHDVSFTLPAGVIAALGGPTAAGSRRSCGASPVSRASTEPRLEGDPLNGGHEVRERVGFLAQAVTLPEHSTIGEVIDLFARLRNADPRRIPLPAGFVRPDDDLIRELLRRAAAPRGARRRVARQPRLLLLDEPIANLDEEGRVAFWDVLGALRDEA